MVKAIIFDMDGVLVDSAKFIWETHNKLLADFGKHVPDEEIPKYLGRRLVEQVELFEENFGIKINNEEYIEKFKVEKQHETEKIPKSPKLIELLKSLKGMQLKLAVATSSGKIRAVHILNHLGISEFFEAFVTAEDVEIGKPNPEIFLKAAEKLGISPEECIVVEDALNGVEAAKNAQMKVIALESIFIKKDLFKEADYVISSLNEIKGILEKEGA